MHLPVAINSTLVLHVMLAETTTSALLVSFAVPDLAKPTSLVLVKSTYHGDAPPRRDIFVYQYVPVCAGTYKSCYRFKTQKEKALSLQYPSRDTRYFCSTTTFFLCVKHRDLVKLRRKT